MADQEATWWDVHREVSRPVPAALARALEANQDLKRALLHSGLPLRFQAMVLGLATLRQVGEDGDRRHR